MHYCLHGKYVRHIYNIVLGLLIQLYLYGFQTMHVVVMSSVVYALMIFLPRKISAPYAMFYVLIHLSC